MTPKPATERYVPAKLLTVILVFMILGLGWALATSFSNRMRLNSVESNRYTHEDGLRADEFNAKERDKLGRNVTIEWFENRMEIIDKSLSDKNHRISLLEERIVELEKKK